LDVVYTHAAVRLRLQPLVDQLTAREDRDA